MHRSFYDIVMFLQKGYFFTLTPIFPNVLSDSDHLNGTGSLRKSSVLIVFMLDAHETGHRQEIIVAHAEQD